MQLTAPAFLLIFLPVTLLLTLPVPKKHRTKALAAVSLLWYALANYHAPAGVLAVLCLTLFTYALLLPRPEQMPRIRLLFGTVLPLSLLLAARLAVEYGNELFRYPYGITFVVLASISATVDRVKGKCPAPDSFFDLAVYLLFFPFLFLGPLIQYRHFADRLKHAAPSVERFATGVRLYMGGTIKYLAISAVLFRSLFQIVEQSPSLYFPFAVLLPLLAFGGFWFLLTGCTDISRGVSYMYGIPCPKSHRVGYLARDPFRLVFGAYHALYAYIKHYVLTPLSRYIKGPLGRSFLTALLLALFGLFFRTRPEALLFLLPLLLFLLPAAWRARPARRYPLPVRVPLILGECLCLMPFLLAISLDEPLHLFTLYTSVNATDSLYHFYYLISAMLNTRYLLISILLAAIFLPISYYRGALERRLRGARLIAFRYAELALLFVGFLFTFVYFLPQFPSYSTLPFLNFYL